MEALQQWIATHNIIVINIETVAKEIDTGLPKMNAGSFKYTGQVLKLWFKEVCCS